MEHYTYTPETEILAGCRRNYRAKHVVTACSKQRCEFLINFYYRKKKKGKKEGRGRKREKGEKRGKLTLFCFPVCIGLYDRQKNRKKRGRIIFKIILRLERAGGERFSDGHNIYP